jgi:ATP-binding cassette, subfamily B, bacterial HlyB/CyaB
MAETSSSAPDSGLLAFVALLRLLAKPADAAQLRHQFAPDGEAFDADHILRAAKQMGLKARLERTDGSRLAKVALPAIARLKDGSYALLARASADRVLLHDFATNRPVIEQLAAFEARWTGELILLTTRERIAGPDPGPHHVRPRELPLQA